MPKNDIKDMTILGLRIYNGILSVMYILIGCLMVFIMLLIFVDTKPVGNVYGTDGKTFIMILMFFVAFILLAFFAIHLTALITANKQTKWNWILQIISVCLGFTSMITIIPCVLLLIGLLSKETKEYYKVSIQAPTI
jgi:hypothetical protein